MARFTIFAAVIAMSLALAGCAAPGRTPESERQPVAQPAPTTIAPDQPAPPAPVPPTPAAPAPATPKPATPKPETSSMPETPKPAPPPAATSPTTASSGAPSNRAAAKPSTAAASKNAAPAAPAAGKVTTEAPASPTLDLGSLERRLKDTRAIGVFTKLSLKNQVDDLLGELRAFHSGATKTPQAELRQQYDTLIIKVLTLLQKGDPQLATAVASSREALWGILMDPKKFSQI